MFSNIFSRLLIIAVSVMLIAVAAVVFKSHQKDYKLKIAPVEASSKKARHSRRIPRKKTKTRKLPGKPKVLLDNDSFSMTVILQGVLLCDLDPYWVDDMGERRYSAPPAPAPGQHWWCEVDENAEPYWGLHDGESQEADIARRTTQIQETARFLDNCVRYYTGDEIDDEVDEIDDQD